MRRSAATLLGAGAGMLAGAAFLRRRTVQHRERIDLYYEDGSMISLSTGSAEAERLLPLAREILRSAR